jgi:hypothetical protein
MRLRCRPLALLAVPALALAACGGEDKLTRQEFVAQADKICADADRKTQALPDPKSPDDLAALIKQAKPIAEQQRDQLRDLQGKAPDEVAGDFGRALDLLDQQLPILDEVAAAGTDLTKVQAASQKGAKLDQEADGLAKKIGLKECGS